VSEDITIMWPPAVFRGQAWQMSYGERAALEGLLVHCDPGLSIEIGTADGGSVSRIAAYSDDVHAIDLVHPTTPLPENVHMHVGDSRKVLPELLESLAAEGRNVDFALVDGDHTSEGVRADLISLLSSPAVGRTVILLHDTMNEVTRAGVQGVPFEDFPKVRYVELDFLTGYMGRHTIFSGQLWGGMGVVIVDESGETHIPGTTEGDPRYYDAYSMVRLLGGRFRSEHSGQAEDPLYSRGENAEQHEVEVLSRELEWQRELVDEYRRQLDSVERSASWRITAPLRRLKRAALRARDRSR
jgi:hypothetical protein